MRHLLALGLMALTMVACGGSSLEAESAATWQKAEGGPKMTPAAGPAAPAAKSAPGTIRRSAVRQVLADGPGRFLQHIEVSDEPVQKNGRFYGFRVTRLNGRDFWDGIDLTPGDVITNVNGMTIERPEQFLQAFRSLDSARELKVAIDRNGQSRELKWAIVDDQP